MLVELTDTGSQSDLSAMRYHELALQRWLNQNFFVTQGYPVPAVYTAPMDAYSHFNQLWADANNPFAYLLQAKDKNGTPLYEPYPAPARYPIFSIHRKGWRPRSWQNYSIHRWRHLGWPTLVSSGTIVRQDLASVMVARMPQAWDFMYQLDFFCRRPDTLAVFVKHMMTKLYRTGGEVPQTWIAVAYPFYGLHFARMRLEGDMAYVTPAEPNNDFNVEYRVSMSLVVEGWEPDIDIQEIPVVWRLVANLKAPTVVDPDVLETIYSKTVELRSTGTNTPNTNQVLAGRENVPPFGSPTYLPQ